jgi:hypothetical protein
VHGNNHGTFKVYLIKPIQNKCSFFYSLSMSLPNFRKK